MKQDQEKISRRVSRVYLQGKETETWLLLSKEWLFVMAKKKVQKTTLVDSRKIYPWCRMLYRCATTATTVQLTLCKAVGVKQPKKNCSTEQLYCCTGREHSRCANVRSIVILTTNDDHLRKTAWNTRWSVCDRHSISEPIDEVSNTFTTFSRQDRSQDGIERWVKGKDTDWPRKQEVGEEMMWESWYTTKSITGMFVQRDEW